MSSYQTLRRRSKKKRKANGDASQQPPQSIPDTSQEPQSESASPPTLEETQEALLIVVEELQRQDELIKMLAMRVQIIEGVLHNFISGDLSSPCAFCNQFPCACLDMMKEVSSEGIDFSEQSE